jgi:hypothetical protein
MSFYVFLNVVLFQNRKWKTHERMFSRCYCTTWFDQSRADSWGGITFKVSSWLTSSRIVSFSLHTCTVCMFCSLFTCTVYTHVQSVDLYSLYTCTVCKHVQYTVYSLNTSTVRLYKCTVNNLPTKRWYLNTWSVNTSINHNRLFKLFKLF